MTSPFVLCRKTSGETGYVPANYVKEVEPKLVSVEVKKPIVVKDVKKVKKTQYVRQKSVPANQKSGQKSHIILTTKLRVLRFG